jgi:hypothetical protein
MTHVPDPTLEFLRQFDDPAKWVIVPNVPICMAFERSMRVDTPTGPREVQVKVTDADLPRIAEEINRLERERGFVPQLTLGHRNPSPGFPQHLQPPTVGFSRGARVGTFGPAQTPCVLSTLYYMRDMAPMAGKYPHRSVDIYPEGLGSEYPPLSVTGVALLKTDPYLPMGMITLAADGTLCFQMGGSTVATETDKEKEEREKREREEKGKPLTLAALEAHPVWQFMCKQMAAAGPGSPGPASVAPPTMPAPAAALSTAPAVPVQTAPAATPAPVPIPIEIQGRLTALEAANAASTRALTEVNGVLARKEAEFLVYQLQLEGVKALAKAEDARALIEKLAAMPKDQRDIYVGEIRLRWEKDLTLPFQMAGAPVGPMIPVAASTTPAKTTDEQHRKAIKHASDKGLGYDAALAEVKAGKV